MEMVAEMSAVGEAVAGCEGEAASVAEGLPLGEGSAGEGVAPAAGLALGGCEALGEGVGEAGG